MLNDAGVTGRLRLPLEPWLFKVEPYSDESFSHFLGRFRRANFLSSADLSSLLGQRCYVVSYWESPSRRRQPDPVARERLCELSGVSASRLSLMWPPGGTGLHWPTRLCGLCYGSSPWHRLSWQLAAQSCCPVHGCELLESCPVCGHAFRLPSHWVDGSCEHCHLRYCEM